MLSFHQMTRIPTLVFIFRPIYISLLHCLEIKRDVSKIIVLITHFLLLIFKIVGSPFGAFLLHTLFWSLENISKIIVLTTILVILKLFSAVDFYNRLKN